MSPYRDQREQLKSQLGWEIKEIHVSYDPLKGKRGREDYWVKDYQAPKSNFLFIDTTDDTEEESLTKIAESTNLVKRWK